MKRGFVLAAIVVASATSYAQDKASADESGEHRLESLPDVLNCNKFSWMENCEAVNRQAKRHPNAPLRVRDRSGLEFNFPPGTPTAVINHMLNPTSQSARSLIEYDKRLQEREQLAARTVREELKRGGEGFDFTGFTERGVTTVDQEADKTFQARLASTQSSEPLDEIAYDKVKVYVFYSSQCPHCIRSIPEWRALKTAHPDLDIRFLQLDNNPPFVKRMNQEYELRARMLQGEVLDAYAKRIQGTPTVWIERQDDRTTRVIEGYQGRGDLERQIAGVSNG